MTTRDPWNPATASEHELRNIASEWSDQFPPGNPGHCSPQNAHWTYDPQFDLSCTGSAEDWIPWFEQECQWADEDGREDAYADMLVGDIVDPIVVVLSDGIGYVWDGNHRVGATFARGQHHLKAIVGLPIDPAV